MRTSLWMAAVVAACVGSPFTASAHFVWVKAEPVKSGHAPVARVFFGEAPEPGDPQLLPRIAGTKLWADGKPLDARPAEGCLEAPLPGLTCSAIDAVCEYGVVSKGGSAFDLRYTARTQARAFPAAAVVAGEHPRLVWVEGSRSQPVLKAVWRGEPVAGAAVTILAEGGDPREVQAGSDGKLAVEAKGPTSFRLKVVEKSTGSRAGKSYAKVRHYATLTIGPEPTGPISTGDEPASADELLRRAHDARACWGPGFPGFSADLAVNIDGEIARGKVDVSPDGTVALDLPEGPATNWARTMLHSIVLHRGLNGPTELEPGATFLEPHAGHPLGRLIQLSDDRMGSAYRVKGDEILEVNRKMKDRRFSNRVLANRRNPEGKLLPEVYTVGHWDDATGKLERTEVHRASWIRVGRLDLPLTHTLVATSSEKSSVRRLELSGHRLKGSSAATAAAR
ncbi:MAG: DUF3386 family protein [Isosphaeraceae bacterium]